MQNLDFWSLLLLLLAIYFATWFGMLAHFAWLGGWSSLARQFGVSQLPTGKRFRFQSASLRLHYWAPVNYGCCLTFVVCDQGLGISIGWPFRFRHPPLLIPWSEFRRVEEQRFLWLWRYVTADIGELPSVKLYLPHWTFAEANLTMAAAEPGTPGRGLVGE